MVVAAVLFAGIAVWVIIAFVPRVDGTDLDNIALAVAGALASIVCFDSGRRLEGASSKGWMFIGASLATWSAGQASLVIAHRLVSRGAELSSSDVAFLGASVLLAVGVANFPSPTKWTGPRGLLDGAIAATSLGYVAWALFFVHTPNGQAFAFAHPTVDIFVLTAILIAVGRATPPRDDFYLLLVGAAAQMIGNTSSNELLAGGGSLDGNVPAVAWAVWLTTTAVAAHRARDRDASTPSRRSSLFVLVPYATVIAALATRVWSGMTDRPLGGWGLAFVVTIVTLLIGRHLLAVVENQELTLGLRSQVEELRIVRDKLLEGQELLDTVLRGLPGGAYKSLVTPTRGRPFVSQGLAEMTGYTTEELMEHGESKLIDPRDVDNVAAGYARAIDEGSATFRYRITTRDGRQRWVENRVRSRAQGEHLALNGFIADVTDEIEASQQEEHARRMDAVGRFASVVAHDFNNILTALRAYTQFARQAASAGRSVVNDLDEIDRATARAATLASQLVAVASPVADSPDVEPLDINATVQSMEAMLAVLMVDVDFNVEMDPPGVSSVVLIQPAAVERALLNLCLNARDACATVGRPDPSVVLRVEHELRSPLGRSGGGGVVDESSETHVLLSVIDNGAGMDPALQETCFEPFVTTKSESGGLGLASVDAIVRSAGGTVSVESTLGFGTRFTLRFPVHPQ